MSFFKKVEGEAVVLVSKGVYRQVDIYTRDGYLYAQHAGGFVRIMADGSTTKADTSVDFMSWGGPALAQRLGRLCLNSVSGAKNLGRGEEQKLLGVAAEGGAS